MGKSGAARVKAQDAAYGAAMQDHEERNDKAGFRRSIRNARPYVYSPYACLDAPDPSVDTAKTRVCDKDARVNQILSLVEEKPENRNFTIMDACAAHVADARKNAGAKKVFLHGFMQFPTEIKPTVRNQRLMLAIAVDFVNETYGGCAVFHARIDRDEKGRHGVDVFFAPRYEKHTASKGTEQWISLSKFSKENARTRYGKRQKEVKKRNKFVPVYDDNGKPVMVWNDADVFQGRALQDAWFEHLKEHVGDRYEVERGERKKGRDPDRLSPEDYAIEQEGRKLRAEVERQLDSEDLEVDVDNPHQDAAAKLIERASDRALAKAQASSEHIIDAAHDTVDQMIVRAHESAVTDVKAIRSAMLGEGDKEFLKMKEELATLRTEVIRQGKILKIWNEVIKRVLPKNMRELLKSAFDATWKKHDDEVVRSEPVPERNVAFRP